MRGGNRPRPTYTQELGSSSPKKEARVGFWNSFTSEQDRRGPGVADRSVTDPSNTSREWPSHPIPLAKRILDDRPRRTDPSAKTTL